MQDFDLDNEEVLKLATLNPDRRDFDLGQVEVSGSSGLDSLFQREAHILKPHATGRTKVASVAALKPFVRLSSDTLVHKSDRDLWALKKEADGSYFIERLFDDNGDPIKG
jgi:hypothetical protein